VAPWEKRIEVIIELDHQKAAQAARNIEGITIATCSSERNGIVGMGGSIDTAVRTPTNVDPIADYIVTLGSRETFNLYIAELTAIAMALRNLLGLFHNRKITILSSNLSALQAVKCPKHQSGQHILRQIYEFAHKLRIEGNQVSAIWVPSQEKITLKARAKKAAKQATVAGRVGSGKIGAKSTILGRVLRDLKEKRELPKGIGKFTTELDRALPGKHTKLLYDSFKRTEAGILAQLRTGMARLNEYLHRIGVSESDQCVCGQASESVKHFLFRCTQWDRQRHQLFRETSTRRGCLSFFLGGKAPSDPVKWTPNISAVRATLKYATATGRLKFEPIEHPEAIAGFDRRE
jgi:hypothetical protein